MFATLVKNLWGLSSGQELKKFLYLSAGAFCLIGSFSPLKPLKDSLFINMVGADYFGWVKGLSSVLMLIVVMVYSKLVDRWSRQTLLYGFLSFFLIIGVIFIALLAHPQLGVSNQTAASSRWVAWGFYLFVECYLTVMISLFWSFVNDVTSALAAKKGYGMIMFGSQSGAFVLAALGALLISDKAHYTTRVPLLLALCMGLFSLLGFFIWRLTQLMPAGSVSVACSEGAHERPVGVLEGLWVVASRSYVRDIFVLVIFQEAITSLIHYQQAYLAEHAFAAKSAVTEYYFSVNLLFQLLSCVFALLGTSYIHRTIGTRASLISFPLVLIGAAIVYVCVPNLYAITLFVVLLKGLHYAFNQPVRETLYIPTSRDIKYKAKAWVDVVGLRTSKTNGFVLASLLGHSSAVLGGAIIGLLSLWALVANRVGIANEKAVHDGSTIQ